MQDDPQGQDDRTLALISLIEETTEKLNAQLARQEATTQKLAAQLTRQEALPEKLEAAGHRAGQEIVEQQRAALAAVRRYARPVVLSFLLLFVLAVGALAYAFRVSSRMARISPNVLRMAEILQPTCADIPQGVVCQIPEGPYASYEPAKKGKPGYIVLGTPNR